jgi:hypothetical protein
MTPDRTNVIRWRQDETCEQILRQRGDNALPAFPAIVGRVFGGPQVPTVLGTYVWLRPVDVMGIERESSPGVFNCDETARAFLAYVVGSSPPVAGDHLVCRFVGHRWVAERMGRKTGDVVIPGCPCASSPAVLHMSSSKPDSNNHMFQSAVLAYGPTPQALLPLGIGQNSYLSTTVFTDLTTGDKFWYHFSCYIGYYVLTRVYSTSLYGTPYRDSSRYRWPIGMAGNSCKPFLLAQGQVFAGGDSSCVVTISE